MQMLCVCSRSARMILGLSLCHAGWASQAVAQHACWGCGSLVPTTRTPSMHLALKCCLSPCLCGWSLPLLQTTALRHVQGSARVAGGPSQGCGELDLQRLVHAVGCIGSPVVLSVVVAQVTEPAPSGAGLGAVEQPP